MQCVVFDGDDTLWETEPLEISWTFGGSRTRWQKRASTQNSLMPFNGR